MIEYHKIHSVFKRDPETNHKTFLEEFSRPEFGYLGHLFWQGTEKIDGTNVRLKQGMVMGKTDNANLHSGLVQACMPIVSNQDKWREVFGDDYQNFTLYGEGYGAGIQKGGAYRPDKAFVLFDVRGKDTWLEQQDVWEIGMKFDIPSAPLLGNFTLHEWVRKIKDGTCFRESELHAGAPNEGVVLRPLVELNDKRGERIITKLKFKDFDHA